MEVAHDVYKRNKPDADGPSVNSENMPNYKGKRIITPSHSNTAMVNILTPTHPANQSVTNVPIMFTTTSDTGILNIGHISRNYEFFIQFF
jgi:hypothetical protein